MKAMKEACTVDVKILQDAELPKLYELTNWKSKHEVQRYSILILGYYLGWRPDSMEKNVSQNVQTGQIG